MMIGTLIIAIFVAFLAATLSFAMGGSLVLAFGVYVGTGVVAVGLVAGLTLTRERSRRRVKAPRPGARATVGST